MYIFVAYDISINRTRVRVSKECKKAGLLRLQKSMFVGKINAADLKNLEGEVRASVGEKDKWVVMRINKREFRTSVEQSGEARLQALVKQGQFWNF